jgi:hypothetical protein
VKNEIFKKLQHERSLEREKYESGANNNRRRDHYRTDRRGTSRSRKRQNSRNSRKKNKATSLYHISDSSIEEKSGSELNLNFQSKEHLKEQMIHVNKPIQQVIVDDSQTT